MPASVEKNKVYGTTACLSLVTNRSKCSTHAACLPGSGFQMAFPFSHNGS